MAKSKVMTKKEIRKSVLKRRELRAEAAALGRAGQPTGIDWDKMELIDLSEDPEAIPEAP